MTPPGVWQCAALPALGSAKPEVGGSTRFSKPDDPRAAALAPSLVGVGFDMPYSVSGITERNYRGTGLVVDAARGLVVVDRNTVPVSMGDVRIIFAGTLEIPGKVEFVHPLHNLAIVSYDPKLIGNTPVQQRQVVRPQDRAGRDAVGGRHGCRTASSTRARRRWRSLDAHPAAAVAHHAVPREQSRNRPARERADRFRRRAHRRPRAASSACGRASPGKAAASCSRRIAASPSASCRTCSAACRRKQSAVFARSRARAAAAGGGAPPRPAGRLAAQVRGRESRTSARCCPSCASSAVRPPSAS